MDLEFVGWSVVLARLMSMWFNLLLSVILTGVLSWAVFWDSKKKRPDVPWFWRYVYIITFKRMKDW